MNPLVACRGSSHLTRSYCMPPKGFLFPQMSEPFDDLDKLFGPGKCFYCGRTKAFSDLGPFKEPGKEDYVSVCQECLSGLLKHYKREFSGSAATPYAEYLRSEHWLSVKRNAIQVADRRCQLCNAADQILDVHHRTYERLGNEKPSDLIVLCRSCHERHHLRSEGGDK